MKIILFAVVCVAFTQVYGSELDDKIKEAIQILDSITNATQIVFQFGKDEINGLRRVITARTPIHIQKNIEFRDDAISAVKNLAKELTAQANQNKLPQEVIKCIAKEEEKAIASISSHSTKFEADMKAMTKEKLAFLDKEDKNLRKLEDMALERYKTDVTTLKNCKDVSSLRETLLRIEGEHMKIMTEMETIIDSVSNILMEYEKDSKFLTLNANSAITVAKNVGLKNMRECMPKTY